MIRLRVAGGLLASDWVPIRLDRNGKLHCIVEAHHWRGLEAQDIVVDVDLEDGNVELEEVLHRLVSRRHAEHRDDEDEEMQEGVTQGFKAQRDREDSLRREIKRLEGELARVGDQKRPQTATSTATDGPAYKRSRAAGPAPQTQSASRKTSRAS